MPDYKLELEGIAIAGAGMERTSTPSRYAASGYAVLDGYMTWKPFENVRLRAGVLNIFDTRYFPPSVAVGYTAVPTCTTPGNCVSAVNPLELQVAPGRTFRVGLTVDF
jgi:hemoglobin/transferrin/lactoferrin receptor protein